MKGALLSGAAVIVLIILIISLTGTVQADGPVVVDHTSVALFESIPAEYLTAAQGVEMFYNDRSVGWNLDDALSRLGVPRGNITFLMDSAVSGTVSGCTGYDVCGYFPSYLDYRYSGKIMSDPSEFKPLLSLPADTLVWTSSLARGAAEDGGQRAQIEAMNKEIRAWAAANGLPLLDVADILSHDPDGKPCYDNWDGIPSCNAGGTKCEDFPDDGLDTPAICPAYTDEVFGGHLNRAGGERLSKAVWVTLAQLAGWQPEPVTTDPTPAPPTATPEPTVAPLCREDVDLSGYDLQPLPANEVMDLRASGADITPRDATGAPDPDGRIGVVIVGHSITQKTCSELERNWLPAGRDPHIVWLCGAVAGIGTIDNWADPTHAVWDELDKRLAASGLTDAQVQVVFSKLALIAPVKPGGESDYIARMTDYNFAVQDNLEAKFPNMAITFPMPLFARHTQQYGPGVTSNEPAGFLSRYAVEAFRDRYVGEPHGIRAVVIGPDIWVKDWPASLYEADCVHPLFPDGYVRPAQKWADWLRANKYGAAWWYYTDAVIWPTPTGVAPTATPTVVAPTATPEPTLEPTVTATPEPGGASWVAEIAGAWATQKHDRWRPRVRVIVVDGAPLVGVEIAGEWSTGHAGTCVTRRDGGCTLSGPQLPLDVTEIVFQVRDVAAPGYDPARNVASSVVVSRETSPSVGEGAEDGADSWEAGSHDKRQIKVRP